MYLLVVNLFVAARRKPGPKPRRVIQQNPPGPSASPSLAQLFASATESPRSSSGLPLSSTTPGSTHSSATSGNEDSDSQTKVIIGI
jgi:hypothetical protein